MSTKQKTPTTKRKRRESKTTTSASQDEKLVGELDALLGTTTTTEEEEALIGTEEDLQVTPASSSKATTTKKKATKKRKVNLFNRDYSKNELLSKLLMVSEQNIVPKAVLMNSIKEYLSEEKYVELLKEQPEYSQFKMSKSAFELLHAALEHRLLNIFYGANVLSCFKKRQTVDEGCFALGELITNGKFGIHGDREEIRKALRLAVGENAKLGEDVEIDKIASQFEVSFGGLSKSEIKSIPVDTLSAQLNGQLSEEAFEEYKESKKKIQDEKKKKAAESRKNKKEEKKEEEKKDKEEEEEERVESTQEEETTTRKSGKKATKATKAKKEEEKEEKKEKKTTKKDDDKKKKKK